MSKKFKLVTRADESQVELAGFVEQLNSTSQDVEDVKVRVKDVEVTLSQLNIQIQQLNRSLKNRPEEFDADTKQVHDALKEIKDWKTTQRLIEDLAYRLEKLEKREKDTQNVKKSLKNLEDRVISLEERMVRMNLNKSTIREHDLSHLEQKFLQMMSVYKQSMEEKEELLSNKIEKILVNMKENIPSSSRQPHDCKINLERIESLIESEIMKRQKAWIEVSEAAWNAERNCSRVAEEMMQKTEEIDNKLKAMEIKMNSKETDWSIFDVKLDPKEAPLKTADLERKSGNILLKHREQSDSSVDYSGESPSPSFGERHFAKFSSKKAGKKKKSPKEKGRVLTVIYKQPRFSGRKRNLSGSSDS